MRSPLLLIAVVLPAATFAQDKVSKKLQPLAPLVEQCAAYEDLVRHWKPVYTIGFSKTSAPTWNAIADDPQAVPPKGKRPATKIDKTMNREVLSLDQHESFGGGSRVMIGPEVSGDYAVEMRAKGVAGFSNVEGYDLKSICDLSIIIGDIERDAGFQFGANFNSRNFLWAGSTTGADGKRTHVKVELPMPPKIEKRRWYRVRLTVKNGVLSGYVDGKLLGHATMVKEYDQAAPRRATVCNWASEVYLDQFKIEQPAAKPVAPKEAWSKIFGETQPQAVQEKLATLAQFLLDDNEELRLAAETMLRRAGSLAVAPLQDVAKSASDEKARLPHDLSEVLAPPPIEPE